MFEWHKNVQVMINVIEEEIRRGMDEELTLDSLAKKLGYSKYHMTKRFKNLTGQTFRDYFSQRKLAYSAIALRDTDRGILDVAVQYGYDSQEAYTRAFRNAFGVTPGAYRREKIPLALHSRKNPFDPYFLGMGETSMSKSELQEVTKTVVTLPAHKFLHVRNPNADSYFEFWALQEKIPGQDCDTVCGLLDSISEKLDRVTGKIGEFDGQIGGNYYDESGKKGYVYGIRLPADYSGALPKQMICADVPQREYLVFAHPVFDYEKIGDSVCAAVDGAAENYDYVGAGYEIDKAGVIYQIHSPEHLGYRRYVPVKAI